MATYIQGITDYIPKLQPFQPDFNFFQKVLEAKQQQYDAGYNKISALYGDLLNSNLMRQPNIDRRNEFFTDIDNEIKRLSGVDLSLQENVQQAKGVFQPLIDNPYFRKDLVFTKSYQKAKSKGESLRNKPDPKSGVQWWAEGDRALDYQAEDFSKSSDEESLGFSSNLRYVPFVDAASKLYAFAKDNDINPETLTKEGGYFITRANGQQAIPKLQSVFSNVLLNDPRVKDMFSTEAYLDRKNYMKSNAEKFQGDELAAETEYLKTKVNDINSYYREANVQAQKEKDQANTKKKAIEATITRQGIDPDLDKDLIELYQGTAQDQQITSENADKTNEVLSETELLDFDGMDRQALRFRVDNAMSYFKMDQFATNTAVEYAMAKEKIKDLQVDQYSLEAVKFKYASALEDQRFNNDKILKIMDIVGEMMKNNGKSVPGSDPTGLSINGMQIPIPGAGNVSLNETDIQEKNAAAIANVEQADENAVKRNMQLFLDKQNAILGPNSTATQAEKDLAKQEIEKTLGIYTEKKEPGYSYTTDKDTDWGQAGMGALTAIGGLGLTVVSGIGEVFSLGTATPLAAAGIAVGATGMAYGGNEVYQGFAGDQTITVPEKVVGTSGFARQKADGSYELVFNNNAIKDPNSNDYYIKVNDRINVHNSGMAPLDLKNPNISLATYQAAIDANNNEINSNKAVLETQKEILVENNKKIGAALSMESGVDEWHSGQFWTSDQTRAKTREEFIEDFVKAHTGDYQNYPSSGEYGTTGYESGTEYTIPDEERFADMRDDADEMYDDLTDAYETLSKNPEAILGLKSFDTQALMGLGANRLMGTAAMYSWDPVNFGDPGFRIATEIFMKDAKTAIDSEAFRNQKGAKFMFGNGFNITKDDYEDADNNAAAARILNFAMSSALATQGGKANEKTDRSRGNVYVHTVAANDGNKMAVTYEFSEEMVKANAGTKDQHGPTWELAKALSDGQITTPQITFFIDSDKIQSNALLATQSTKEEFLLDNGKLALDYKYGGNIKYTKNALGGISYSGYAQSVNELGELVQNPVFGTLLGGENINSVYATHHEVFSAIAQANLGFMQDLRTNNPNAIKDMAALEQILQGQ
jgi:hypothetical protein